MKLSIDTVKEISKKRNEPAWLLEWRLFAFEQWKKMEEPHFGTVEYDPIDYDSLDYYNESKPINNDELKKVYEDMGLPESEQKALLGMATDTVIDSRSVHTSWTKELKKHGIIFLPFSEAVLECPDIVQKYLGSVVPNTDNFFAALNASVFSDGTFAYIPPKVKCPIDLASYFRIETAKIAQFERTLIIADKGSEVSYMEGCSAPRRPNHQLHSGVVEIVALDNSTVKYATVQNWYAGKNENNIQTGGIYNFVTKRGKCFKNAKLYWTQLEVGSSKTWKYPSTILQGDNSSSDFFSLTISKDAQQTDTGTKMIHIGKNTTSNILSYGVAQDSSVQTFRSLVAFYGKGGKNASKCDGKLIGNKATLNTIPKIIYDNGDNVQSHEAKTGAIDAFSLLYLQQCGLSEDDATALIVSGIANPILSRLPMEFLVESNQIIKMALSKE